MESYGVIIVSESNQLDGKNVFNSNYKKLRNLGKVD